MEILGEENMTERAKPTWLKSTLSQGGDCVEWALDPDEELVLVRDSKNPDGAQLSFTLSEWQAFLGAVRLGEADLPSYRESELMR